ncbi:uncharacterized protein LOC116997366 isoform X2 [Catharus ustulatus]|uniref:uncharacterized protein LOC116997366 isoform X2 n=1 Tax=Catharus ustulatus TaxID=91951 RepID=UPI00140CEA61|nr:uncharacterized protein LOC116997366 isoform X2 [Catharus ustulatus]
MLNSLSKEVSVPTLECTSIPSHEECESDPQGSMSREVDPKGCHLLEKSSQLVSQSTEPIKRSVEIHAGSEELLPFPGDRALTSGKTAEREEEENAEVVNGDHQSKEGSGSDENCVGSVSAQAGSERNCESFPDDSSEDPVEGSDSSIKPKIPLSDPVVVPNFFLPPQEMEASMRLLSTSSHPSASPEGPSATMVGLKPPEVPPTATMKFISAGMAGCITDLCTFPLDTAKVRLQAAHLRVPAGLGVPAGPGVPTPALSRHRRGHAAPGWLHHGGCGRGLCAAHRRGQGTPPNIARNAVINCGELVTYDLIKDALLRAQLMADNVPCHFVAAFGAGFCATVVASPVDVVKTRYMNTSPGQYSNVLSCLLALLTQDGPAGLYKGAIVLALRVTPVKLTFSITFGAPNNFPLISNYSDPAGAGDKPLALHGQGSRPVSESQHGPDVLDMVDVLIESSDGFDEAIGFSLSEDMIIQTFPFSAVVPAALEARNILLLQSENGTGR